MTWSLLSVMTGGYLAAGLAIERAGTSPLFAPARKLFLPGPTSHGHHQIELACESCHDSPFGGGEVLQEACVRCHGPELKAADDKHPMTKFTDPRNAELIQLIDATRCTACHVEHRPEITSTMGVTRPGDVCFHCHQSIAKDRPSHAGLSFKACASAGCHNFHDNRALYEDFLLRHLDDEPTRAATALPPRDFHELAGVLPDYPSEQYPVEPLTAAQADAPADVAHRESATADWLASRHARAGVNCSACHGEPGGRWVARPTVDSCKGCHELEVKGFLGGKHGMRLAQGLPPMEPVLARIPMRDDSLDTALGCTTCHGAHGFDTRRAAVEACLGCHADDHSLAYTSSPHYELWKHEVAGTAPPGTGVSCATCHMPRVEHRNAVFDLKRVLVQHNQNDTLRPNEKMLRPVCLECHGLSFAIDALADPACIADNFSGPPGVHVRSLDMAAARLREHEARRASATE